MKNAIALTVQLLLISCGGGRSATADATWMLGTYSTNGNLGCTHISVVYHMEFREDGAVLFRRDHGGDVDQGFWEQTGPDTIRIYPDEAYSDAMYYPFEDGTAWEVQRERVCDGGGPPHRVIEIVNLDDGSRLPGYTLSAGEYCAVTAPDCNPWKIELCGNAPIWDDCE